MRVDLDRLLAMVMEMLQKVNKTKPDQLADENPEGIMAPSEGKPPMKAGDDPSWISPRLCLWASSKEEKYRELWCFCPAIAPGEEYEPIVGAGIQGRASQIAGCFLLAGPLLKGWVGGMELVRDTGLTHLLGSGQLFLLRDSCRWGLVLGHQLSCAHG